MVIVDTTTQSIALTRGDYAALCFCAYESDNQMYELSMGDTVQLQVGKKYGTPLKKWVKVKEDESATTDADYTIQISPEDTKDMKFGDYVYDVSIITAGGDVCTYIGNTGELEPKFTILKEVGGTDD